MLECLNPFAELEMMQQQMKMAISTNEELAKQKDTAQQKAAATAQSAAGRL